ncbi:MAG: Opr family porin [Helicobacteraceae bacterium]|jgi:hypothetical protein|nr:Opr family porin [Helicobacteraceae bacterium]
MKKLSLIAAAALVAASGALAADAKGEAKLEALLYGQYDKWNLNDEEKNAGKPEKSGILQGSFNVLYNTGEIANGASLNMGARMNRKLAESHEGDWVTWADGDPKVRGEQAENDNTVFHTANLTWTNGFATIVAGRQYVELEWLGDYHEALVGVLTPHDFVTIVGGWTRAYATADYDGYNAGFDNFHTANGVNGNGAGVLDITIAPVEGLKIEPWFYHIPEVANWTGGKIAYENEFVGVSAAYTISKSDSKLAEEDDNFLHVTANVNPAEGLKIYAGLGKAGDKEGAPNLLSGVVGENITPFEDGALFLTNGVKTIYGGVGYEVGGLNLNLLYGVFDLSKGDNDEDGGKASELDFVAEYAMNKNFSARLALVSRGRNDDAYAQNGAEKFTSGRLALIYNYGTK